MNEVPVFVVDLKEIVRGEHDENVMRKDFLPSEKVAIGEVLWPEEYEAAKERQRLSPGRGKKVGQITTPFKVGKTQDRVAAKVGMAPATYGRAKAIIQLGERKGFFFI